MSLFFFRNWGLEYLVITPQEWAGKHESHFWLKLYEVLDLPQATCVLRQIARVDERFLASLARDALPYGSAIHFAHDPWHDPQEDRRMLDELERALGYGFSKPGQPPAFAQFYICRRKHAVPAPLALPDPWADAREAFERAKRAPGSFVVVEAFTEGGLPVPSVELQVVLADGELRTGCSDARGKLHLEPVPEGQCHIRVAGLDASAWRPAAGAPSVRVDHKHACPHVMKRGEGLSRVAKQHGLYGWKKLWLAPANEELRKLRKHPNLLQAGDELVVPGLEIHELVRLAGQTHRVVLREPRAALAVLNTHLLQDLGSVDAHWPEGSANLTAVTSLFRDATSAALRLNDAPEGATLALLAPPGSASAAPAETSATGDTSAPRLS